MPRQAPLAPDDLLDAVREDEIANRIAEFRERVDVQLEQD